jgi:hypothetical protein
LRVQVFVGCASILGARLSAASPPQDVVAPAFQSSLSLAAAEVGDVRACAVRGCAASSLAASVPSVAGGGPLLRCVVGLSPIPAFAACLRAYDVEGAGLPLEAWSLDVVGAVVCGAGGAVACVQRGGTGEGAEAAAAAARQRVPRCRVPRTTVHVHPSWEAVAGALCGGGSGGGSGAGAGSSHFVPTVFVGGPTGCGKSTLVRFLVNALLSQQVAGVGAVAFLDLDLGQPEHTPPGMLSLAVVARPLLTPPHLRTHFCLPGGTAGGGDGDARWAAATPSAESAAAGGGSGGGAFSTAPAAVLRMHFLGAPSPRDGPAAFIAAASALIAHYREALAPRGVPLVVNSHGWVRGLGFEALSAVLAALAPTHTVLLTTADAREQQQQRLGGGALGEEALAPPPLAWQPAPGLGALSIGSGGAAFSVPAAVVRLPAWHNSAGTEGEGGAEGDGGGGGAPLPPPRAARSPPDLRAARLLLYFLSNLRFVSPEAAAGGAAAAAASAAPEGGAGEDRLAAAGEEEDAAGGEEDAPLASGGEEPPPLAAPTSGPRVTAVFDGEGAGAGGEASEGEEEERARGGAGEEGSGTDGDEGDGGDDDADADHSAAAAAGLGGDDDADEGALRACAGAGSAPLSLLPPAAAHALYWRALRSGARAAFLSVLNDTRLSRAPTAGARSPAYLAAAALAMKVPAGDVCVLLSPGQRLPLLRSTAGGGWEAALAGGGAAAAAAAAALVGHLVALCECGGEGGGGADASAAAWDAAAAPFAAPLGALAPRAPAPAALPAAALPCVGVGIVRHYDAVEGLLHVLTPLPLAAVARVRVLVAWGGQHDVPAALLFRAAPEGDPHCFHPQLLARVGGGNASSGGGRKQLKRRRLAVPG